MDTPLALIRPAEPASTRPAGSSQRAQADPPERGDRRGEDATGFAAVFDDGAARPRAAGRDPTATPGAAMARTAAAPAASFAGALASVAPEAAGTPAAIVIPETALPTGAAPGTAATTDPDAPANAILSRPQSAAPHTNASPATAMAADGAEVMVDPDRGPGADRPRVSVTGDPSSAGAGSARDTVAAQPAGQAQPNRNCGPASAPTRTCGTIEITATPKPAPTPDAGPGEATDTPAPRAAAPAQGAPVQAQSGVAAAVPGNTRSTTENPAPGLAGAADQAAEAADDAGPRRLERAETPADGARTQTLAATAPQTGASKAVQQAGKELAAQGPSALADAAAGDVPVPMPEGHGADRAAPASASAALRATPFPGVATPVPPAVAQVAGSLTGAQGSDITLRLDPPELGSVRITLSSTDGQLAALVTAERADVDQMLRRHATALQQALQEAGYDSVDLSFASHGGDDSPRDAPPNRNIAQAGPEPVERPAPRPVATAQAATGGLDLRL